MSSKHHEEKHDKHDTRQNVPDRELPPPPPEPPRSMSINEPPGSKVFAEGDGPVAVPDKPKVKK